MTRRLELTSRQFARIEAFLPGKIGDPGRSGNDNRAFVNGAMWVLRSDTKWRYLPVRYGKWKSAHARFARWAKSGIWVGIFEILAGDNHNVYLERDLALLKACRILTPDDNGLICKKWRIRNEHRKLGLRLKPQKNSSRFQSIKSNREVDARVDS